MRFVSAKMEMVKMKKAQMKRRFRESQKESGVSELDAKKKKKKNRETKKKQ